MKIEIPGYEGLYAADEEGTIWSLQTTSSRRAGPIKSYENTGGYRRVNLFDKDGRCKHEYVHRLVASAFLPNPYGYRVVNHKDADRTNNRPDNLEWCSQKYNIAESRKLGHQSKDRSVIAYSMKTGEIRCYKTLRDAGVDLFGKYYALHYNHQRKGRRFTIGDWKIEVDR